MSEAVSEQKFLPHMDCILAAKLLSTGEKVINKENMLSLYEAIGASCATEEVEQLLESLGDSPLEDFLAKGREMMFTTAVASAPTSAPAETAQENEKANDNEADEEEDDDFDMFDAF